MLLKTMIIRENYIHLGFLGLTLKNLRVTFWQRDGDNLCRLN